MITLFDVKYSANTCTKYLMLTMLYLSIILSVGLISCKKDYSCKTCLLNANKPPIADAGPDRIITLPKDTVLLNGAASSDADGVVTKYEWSKISGPTSTIVHADSSGSEIKSLQAGVSLFQLTVTDNLGDIDKDTVQITVIPGNTVNHPPIANAGADQTITLPLDSTYLDGSGSFPNGWDTPTCTTFVWSMISGTFTDCCY